MSDIISKKGVTILEDVTHSTNLIPEWIQGHIIYKSNEDQKLYNIVLEEGLDLKTFKQTFGIPYPNRNQIEKKDIRTKPLNIWNVKKALVFNNNENKLLKRLKLLIVDEKIINVDHEYGKGITYKIIFEDVED